LQYDNDSVLVYYAKKNLFRSAKSDVTPYYRSRSKGFSK